MAKNKKNNDVGEGILAALAIFGGALLTAELLKTFSKKETVYDCPVCNYAVKFGTTHCPNCNSKLSWPSTPEKHG